MCGFEGLADAFAGDGFDEWDGVLVSEDGADAAEAVAFFGEFNDEGFDFFWFVFAPVWWASADWADGMAFSFFLFWHRDYLNSAPMEHGELVFKISCGWLAFGFVCGLFFV